MCLTCHNTFTTHEKADLETALTVRYTTRDIRPFSRDTLFISLYESCKHRPEAIHDANGLTQTIISQLQPLIRDAAITRQEVITTAHTALTRFDKTAAAVYAAFHKS